MKNDCYEFDFDKNGVLALTERNVYGMNFIIENDSDYRLYNNNDSPLSIAKYIKNITPPFSYDEILHIVTEIDRQNSTHQNVFSTKKDSDNASSKNNGGREITAQYIYNIGDLYKRLRDGDASLVNEIAKALCKKDGGGRYTFSFASKFCTYVSRALYNSDEYSVYDNVLADILPYYGWAYLKKSYCSNKNKSTIRRVIGVDIKEGNYALYRDLIDDIRDRNKILTGYQISRKDFDQLLWYYFKGDRDIRDKNTKEVLHISRTTLALNCVGKENTVL